MELERAIRLAEGKYKNYFEAFLDESYSSGAKSDDRSGEDDDSDDGDDSDGKMSDTDDDEIN
jgi:hypothetical protein